jgi:hypothetical protein
MRTRNILAVFVGLILGCVGGYFVANAGYGAAVTLGFWGILSPLIVYRIAERKALWISVVPNVVLVLVVAGLQRYNYRYKPFQVFSVLSGVVVISLFSLLIAAPVYLMRSYLSKRKKSSPKASN